MLFTGVKECLELIDRLQMPMSLSASDLSTDMRSIAGTTSDSEAITNKTALYLEELPRSSQEYCARKRA